MKMNLPTLNMADWSILDFELAFDGIRHINDASTWLQNQPRAYSSRLGDYHPGADFIVHIGEGWCSTVIDDLVKRLEMLRFPDPGDDDRRIRLLVAYYAGYGASGEPVPALLAMIEQQRHPPA